MNLEKLKARSDKNKALHAKDPRTNTFNAIIFGPPKIGKSSIISTCRAPILVHSFDPGGTKVLKKDIEKGRVEVNSSFEREDPFKPWVFKDWVEEMKTLDKDGYFDYLGTFVMDSTTTWAQNIMYEVIRQAAASDKKKIRRAGGHPHENDWLPQMQHIENWMRIFTGLSCDCVLIGHSDTPRDRDSGRTTGDTGLMITGKLRTKIPALYDEVYFMTEKSGKRKLQTTTRGGVQSGTRLGHGGLLDEYEEPNIKNILKKVGSDWKDKPLIGELLEKKV